MNLAARSATEKGEALIDDARKMVSEAMALPWDAPEVHPKMQAALVTATLASAYAQIAISILEGSK